MDFDQEQSREIVKAYDATLHNLKLQGRVCGVSIFFASDEEFKFIGFESSAFEKRLRCLPGKVHLQEIHPFFFRQLELP